MFKARDLQTLFEPRKINLVLIVGFGALLGPLVSYGRYLESNLPLLLFLPSLFWIVLFAYSMLLGLKAVWTRLFGNKSAAAAPPKQPAAKGS
jgi:hypothetical protein